MSIDIRKTMNYETINFLNNSINILHYITLDSIKAIETNLYIVKNSEE